MLQLLILLILCRIKGGDTAEASRRHENMSKLFLKGDAGEQFLSSGFIKGLDGTDYQLSHLKHYHGLSPRKYLGGQLQNDEVIDAKSGKSFSVYRAEYQDGTTILAEKDDNGDILVAEVRRPKGKLDLFLVRKTNNGKYDDAFLSFTEYDLDYDYISSQFHYGEITPPNKGGSDKSNKDDVEMKADASQAFQLNNPPSRMTNPNLPNFHYVRGDGTSTECTYFKVVNVAIVYDSEFCQQYGTKRNAISRIETIVTSASIQYEKDMCVTLNLTGVHTKEASCVGLSRVFSNSTRDKACNQGEEDSFLNNFTAWMEGGAREDMGVDESSAVHMFTGYPPPQGTVGCAWIGVLCDERYAYGVDYVGFTTAVRTQSIIFAHELGHNLNAHHYVQSGSSHIMGATLSGGVDGFSQTSIDQIHNFLDDVQCDTILTPQPPPIIPTATPTKMLTDEEVPSIVPFSEPYSLRSGIPSLAPSSAPSSEPFSLLSGKPSSMLSSAPSSEPSLQLSGIPSLVPSIAPSSEPSLLLSGISSLVPSSEPSSLLSGISSSIPSSVPTSLPSSDPSFVPSFAPSSKQVAIIASENPTKAQHITASSLPSMQPTEEATKDTYSTTTSSCNVVQKNVDSPICIIESKIGNYACIQSADLMSISLSAACLTPDTITTNLLHCGGGVNRGELFSLKDEKNKKKKQKKNKRKLRKDNSRSNDDRHKNSNDKKNDGSNNHNDDVDSSFGLKADDCNEFCVFAADLACFWADTTSPRHYNLTYEVFEADAKLALFSTSVVVVSDDDIDGQRNKCHLASTACISQ